MWKILIVCIISSHYSLTSNAPIELLLLTLFWILRYFIPSATYPLNNTNTNNCVLFLLFLILTMSTKTFLVYVLSCFSFALLSALFLMHNNQNPFSSSLSSLPSTSTRYGSGTDRIWPVQNFLTFFFSSSNIALFNLDYLCFCVGIETELETCFGHSYWFFWISMWNRWWCWWWWHFRSYA